MFKLKITAPFKIERDENDEIPFISEDEVLVSIKRVSLCGSDIKLLKGEYDGPCHYPVIFGHEWSGEITGTAADEKLFKVGDRVTGDCSLFCDECDACKKDKNLCRNIKKAGITTDGYARDLAVVKKKYIYKASGEISFKALALCEIFAVALHAIKRSGIKPEDKNNILIIGCGAVGLAAFFLLKYKYKYKNISLKELFSDKRTALKNIFSGEFADDSFVSGGYRTDGTYEDIYDSKGFDYVFEASGSTNGLADAMMLAAPEGIISYLGMSNRPLEMSKLITLKALKLSGSIGGTGEFEEVLEFFKEYGVLAEKMVTFEIDCRHAEEAFFKAVTDPGNIKSQIVF